MRTCGHTPAEPASVPPETRLDAVTQLLDARLRSTTTGADAATEVRKRSVNLMAWCGRCSTGIHIQCANDHAIGHGGDDCIGAYRASDIAARSLLCLDCWTIHRPYVDESDEDEVERRVQPERHPNRLRWRWPGQLKELLDAAARRERAAHAELLGGDRTTGDERAARRPRRAVAAPRPQQRSVQRRRAGALVRCRPRGTRQCGRRPPLAGTPPQRRNPPGEPPGSPPSSQASTSAAPGATPPAPATT